MELSLKNQGVIWIFLTVILSGCDVGPAYYPPNVEVPNQWKNPAFDENNLLDVDCWWEIFDDPILDALENQAVSNNRNLLAALDVIQEARALTGIARADLYPEISLVPSFTNAIMLEELYTNATHPFFREHQRMYNLPLRLNYEVDLWGQYRNLYKSALYHLEAEIEDYNTVLLILTSDLATAYYQARTLDLQKQLLKETIETRQKAFDINEARYEAKIVNYSDVSRAGLEVSNAWDEFYEIERERAQLENQIAVLIGALASEFVLPEVPLQGEPPKIPAGIPSDILKRRPDIAEAEWELASKFKLIDVAYAAFFPSVSITALGGYSSPVFKYFLRNFSRMWSYAINIDQTLFDAGRKFSRLELEAAEFYEAEEEYQQQVLIAFQEVEDALASIDFYERRSESLEQSVAWTKKTYQISFDRYMHGVTFYLDVVDSERDELTSAILLNSVNGARFISTIQLIKALGGGWGPYECEE